MCKSRNYDLDIFVGVFELWTILKNARHKKAVCGIDLNFCNWSKNPSVHI